MPHIGVLVEDWVEVGSYKLNEFLSIEEVPDESNSVKSFCCFCDEVRYLGTPIKFWIEDNTK